MFYVYFMIIKWVNFSIYLFLPMKQVCLIRLVLLWTDLQLIQWIWRARLWIVIWLQSILLSLFWALLNIEKGTPLESSLSSFQTLKIWKYCRAFVLFSSLTEWKWHLLSISLTLFRTEINYLRKRNTLIEHGQ